MQKKKMLGGELQVERNKAELQITAGKILRGKKKRPVPSRNCRLTVSFHGSVEVDDSPGIFQLENI